MPASPQGIDIDARQALERIALLSRVSAVVVGSAPLTEQMLETVSQVREAFGVEACVLRELREDGLHLLASAGFNPEALLGVMSPSEGIASRLLKERCAITIAGIPTDPLTANLHATAPKVKFDVYAGAPMLVHGEIMGLLGIYSSDPARRFLQDDLDHLQVVANHVGTSLLNARLYRDLSDAYDRTLEGWSTALEFRDSDTMGHTMRVAETTVKLARAMGIPEREIIHIRRGALLHDIGKMAIPDAILLKAGPLTDEESTIMRRHTERAREMLEPIAFLRPALDIPCCHHERWDGSGYPRGMRGEEIPLAARLFAVVDVWDAMCSDRPYRAGMSENKVREYLSDKAGVLFDENAVRCFLDTICR